MHSLKSISSNSLFIFIEKFCKILTYFLVGIVVARQVGPEVFGSYSALLSLTVIFTAIASSGLNSLLVKEYIISNDKQKVITSATFIRIISSIICAFILFLIIYFYFNYSLAISITSIFIVIMSLTQVIDLYFESTLENIIVSKYKVISYIIGAIGKLVVAIYFPNVFLLFLAHFIELSISFSLAFLVSNDKIKLYQFKGIDFKYTRELFFKSFPLLLSSIASILYLKVDQVFIISMMDTKSTGEYAAAVRLCEGVFIFSAIILPSVFPNLITKKNISEKKFYIYLKKLVILFLVVGICIATITSLLSEEIVSLLYGESYYNSAIILSIYSLSIPIVYVGDLFSRWLIITNNTKLSIYRHMLGLTVNVGLNLVWIPTYGLKGAAMASVVAFLSSIVLFSIFSKKARAFYQFLRV
jgi:O-antigen/teichoic acid export membrane protein